VQAGESVELHVELTAASLRRCWPSATSSPPGVVSRGAAHLRAVQLFDSIDSVHKKDGVITKLELLEFCRERRFSSAKMIAALEVSGEFKITKERFLKAFKEKKLKLEDFVGALVHVHASPQHAKCCQCVRVAAAGESRACTPTRRTTLALTRTFSVS